MNAGHGQGTKGFKGRQAPPAIDFTLWMQADVESRRTFTGEIYCHWICGSYFSISACCRVQVCARTKVLKFWLLWLIRLIFLHSITRIFQNKTESNIV